MRHYRALGLLAAWLAAAPLPAAALTLAELWGIARRENPEIAALEAAAAAAGSAVRRAADDRGPTVSVALRYVWLSERPTLEIPAGVVDEDPRRFFTGPDEGIGGALLVHQDIYTGGAVTARIRGAESGRVAAGAQAAAARERICRDLVRAAYRVLALRSRLEVLRESEHLSAGLVDRTREFLENGVLTRLDLLEAQVGSSQAERERAAAEHALALAERGVRRLVGRELESPVAIGAGEPFEFSSPSLAECHAAARHHRPELVAVRSQRDQATRAVELARSRYLPAVSLSGGYLPARTDVGQGSLSNAWSLVAAVTWTPWDFGRRHDELLRAKAEEAGWEWRIRDAEDDIEFEVEAAHRGIAERESALRALSSARAQAGESLTLARQRFEEGLARGAEVLEAQALWARIASESAVAGFELRAAQAELLYATGRLTSSLR